MSLLPEQCAIAFKEWAGICQVLARRTPDPHRPQGRASARGRAASAPTTGASGSIPRTCTRPQQGLRDRELDRPSDPHPGADPGDRVSIQALAVVELVWHIDSETDLLALTPFHIWTLETLRKRFIYRQPGLWVLGVRVFRQRPALDAYPDPRTARLQELGAP